jgi:hypothetical protein
MRSNYIFRVKHIFVVLIIATAWLAGGALRAQIQPGEPTLGAPPGGGEGGQDRDQVAHKKCEDAASLYGLSGQNYQKYVDYCFQQWRNLGLLTPDDFTPPKLPPGM